VQPSPRRIQLSRSTCVSISSLVVSPDRCRQHRMIYFAYICFLCVYLLRCSTLHLPPPRVYPILRIHIQITHTLDHVLKMVDSDLVKGAGRIEFEGALLSSPSNCLLPTSGRDGLLPTILEMTNVRNRRQKTWQNGRKNSNGLLYKTAEGNKAKQKQKRNNVACQRAARGQAARPGGKVMLYRRQSLTRGWVVEPMADSRSRGAGRSPSAGRKSPTSTAWS
jgi:hypothetical protein